MGLHSKGWATKIAGAALAFNMAAGSAAWAQSAIPSESPVAAAPANSNVRSITTVEWDPLMPVGAIAGLGILYGALCLMAARRRMKGAWLLLAAGGVAAAALMNPEEVIEERENLPTEVLVVVDQSPSQSLANRAETTQKARDEVLRQLGEIDGLNIRVVEAGGGSDGGPVDGTELFGAVDEGLADVPRDRLGAVILLTDGQVHDIPERDDPLGSDAPVHALISGREDERDRRIVIDQAPQFGLVHKSQTIKFRVMDEGASGAEGRIRVTASRDGKVVGTQTVTPGQPAEISLEIPHAGPNIVELRAETLPGELTDVNNRAVVTIEGNREKLSVLLVSEPNQGLRTWRELLKSDPDVDLVHFTKMRTEENQDYTPLNELSLIAFPAQEIFSEKIELFDLIIFDSYEHSNFLPEHYLANISRFVENGGAFLFVPGPDYAGSGGLYRTSLGPVLPAAPAGRVIEAPYRPAVSERGERHPVTRNLGGADADSAAQWGRWFSLIDTDVRAGDVLMTGAGDKPLLVLSRKGEGRAAMLLSDNVWLWERNFEGGGPYADLLRQTAHWLMQDPRFEEEALRMSRQDGNVIIEQQTMSDVSAPVTVRTPSGKAITVNPREVSPGIWQASVPAEEIGLYSAELSGGRPLTAFVNVGPANPKEFNNTLSTTDLLEPVAAGTEGRVERMVNESGGLAVPRIAPRPANKADEKDADGVMGIRMTEASVLKGVERDPLIPLEAASILAIAMLAAAYFRQGEYKRNAPSRKDNPAPQ